MATGNETEWHREWTEECLEEICGYANAQGGKIYIGCDDTGHIVGVRMLTSSWSTSQTKLEMLWASVSASSS